MLGDVVNTAARLMSAAKTLLKAGQLVVNIGGYSVPSIVVDSETKVRFRGYPHVSDTGIPSCIRHAISETANTSFCLQILDFVSIY